MFKYEKKLKVRQTPSTVYSQTINEKGFLCMKDGRTFSRRGQMKKIGTIFTNNLCESSHVIYLVTSLDESDLTYYEVYNIT